MAHYHLSDIIPSVIYEVVRIYDPWYILKPSPRSHATGSRNSALVLIRFFFLASKQTVSSLRQSERPHFVLSDCRLLEPLIMPMHCSFAMNRTWQFIKGSGEPLLLNQASTSSPSCPFPCFAGFWVSETDFH